MFKSLRAALILAENERNQTTLLKQDLEAELDSTIDEIALVRTELRALQADFQKQQESIYPYLEVVVHKETKALAKAPEFELLVSNDSPEVGEKINFFASVDDGNTSAYAYSWFIDELRLSDLSQLNQPSISYDFSSSGEYVLRVVVSDMKGGLHPVMLLFG